MGGVQELYWFWLTGHSQAMIRRHDYKGPFLQFFA